MPDLEALESAYREAHEAYADDPTEENYVAYKEAKQEFAEARVEQRQAEEADSDHPRGQGLVQVDDEDGEGE